MRNGMNWALFQDWKANRGTPKMQLLLVFFRLAQLIRQRFGRRHPLALLTTSAYRLAVEILGGFELPVSVNAGPGLAIFHGFGLVVHPSAVIGRDVTFRHGVTVGNTGPARGTPIIGDRVSVGAGASILGSIKIGDDADIGAHALVVRDVPVGGVVRATPAQLTRISQHL